VTPTPSPTATPAHTATPARPATPKPHATPKPSATKPVPNPSPAPRAHATPKPSTPPLPSGALAGKTIVIDPGHNAIYNSANTKLVPAGNGQMKACNTSGTATNGGWPEHTYNWDQANALAATLRSLGAKVVLTRPNDAGNGPCVNVRAGVANQAKADAMVSIHADGNLSKGARGFHVIYSTTMAGGSSLDARSKALATDVRDALTAGISMPRSTYIGHGTALSPRSDLGTLNLLETTPGVMLEMGNMRNASDAALEESSAFRAQVAAAIAQALVKALG